LVDGDGEGVVWVVGFAVDGDAESFVPGVLGEFGDFGFAAVVLVMVLVVGFEDEALEIAEVVVVEAGDLAGELVAEVLGGFVRTATVGFAGPGGGGLNLGGVTAEARDAAAELV
jgi:hypothetical protein